MKQLTLVLLGLTLSGCTTIMNPFNDDFSCPETYNGKCVSITEAYDESLSGQTQQPANETKQRPHIHGIDCDYEEDCDEPVAPKKEAPEDTQTREPQTAEEEYRQALYGKIANLLKEPATPMVATPKVMRVLMLPYEGDDNALYMYRYVYIFAEPPRWILDEIQPGQIE